MATATLTWTKAFTTGLLAGLEVPCTLTGDLVRLAAWAHDAEGREHKDGGKNGARYIARDVRLTPRPDLDAATMGGAA